MKAIDCLLSRLSKDFNSIRSKHRKPLLGGVILFLGTLISFGFNSLAVISDLNGASFWGDLQDAAAFKHERPTQAELVNLRCPIFLAPGETGTITAVFQNSNQIKANILVKTVVSENDFANHRALTTNLLIEPGSEQELQWQISGQDLIEGNFILTRLFLMNQDEQIPYPARTDACGVFVLDLLGLNGTALVLLMSGTSLICLVAGSLLLFRNTSALQDYSPRLDYGFYGLAGILLTGIVTNLLGWWIVAGLLLLLAILLASVLIAHAIAKRI